MKKPIDYETDEEYYESLKEMYRQEQESDDAIVAFMKLLGGVLFIIILTAVLIWVLF